MKKSWNSTEFFKSLKSPLSISKSFIRILSSRKFILSITASSLIAYISFNHLISTEIDLIYCQTPENELIINQIGKSLTGKYKQTPYLPFRFMEIIYGNLFDKREYCNYDREIFYTTDGENIALGKINRLEFLR